MLRSAYAAAVAVGIVLLFLLFYVSPGNLGILLPWSRLWQLQRLDSCPPAEHKPKPCSLLLMHPDGVDLGGRKLSQGNQDQILRAIFRCIGTTNKYFVEFGFDEPTYGTSGGGANTYGLYVDGWRGLLLDAKYHNETINLHNHPLFYTNIADLFQKYNVPRAFDYLSVDMDSHDVFVGMRILEAGYFPRVISFEYNINYATPELIDVPLAQLDPTYESKTPPPEGFKFTFHGCSWGASPAALERLMRRFNYTRILVDSRFAPLDIFYMANDLVPEEGRAFRKSVPLLQSFIGTSYYGKLYGAAQESDIYLKDIVNFGMLLDGRSVAEAKAAASATIRAAAPKWPCWRDVKF